MSRLDTIIQFLPPLLCFDISESKEVLGESTSKRESESSSADFQKQTGIGMHRYNNKVSALVFK